jgi:CRISPR-associated endoribonuclease Cas6
MKIKITAVSNKNMLIPFNYQYILQAAIYNLIKKSSDDYALFLHNTGFIDGHKHLKLFTFSKLFFHHFKTFSKGFKDVRNFTFFFSTPITKSYENLVLGIFSEQKLHLKFFGKMNEFTIESVEVLPEIEFSNSMKMKCLSPIAIATRQSEEFFNKQHFLNYMNPKERPIFVENLRLNLLRKYQILNNQEFTGSEKFEFSFDPDYLISKNGRISKLIHFKNDIKIKAMEAPFTITADPDLIKIGYDCGFGEKNSGGFGMVERVEE